MASSGILIENNRPLDYDFEQLVEKLKCSNSSSRHLMHEKNNHTFSAFKHLFVSGKTRFRS